MGGGRREEGEVAEETIGIELFALFLLRIWIILFWCWLFHFFIIIFISLPWNNKFLEKESNLCFSICLYIKNDCIHYILESWVIHICYDLFLFYFLSSFIVYVHHRCGGRGRERSHGRFFSWIYSIFIHTHTASIAETEGPKKWNEEEYHTPWWSHEFAWIIEFLKVGSQSHNDNNSLSLSLSRSLYPSLHPSSTLYNSLFIFLQLSLLLFLHLSLFMCLFLFFYFYLLSLPFSHYFIRNISFVRSLLYSILCLIE